ncbi:MAG: HAD-IA family hydrolase, partial [Pseudomonadota bacterium]
MSAAVLVCDLDGTLADSAPSLCAAGNRVLATLGRAPVSVETYVGFVGRGQRVQVQRLLEHTGGVPGGDVGPWLARFRETYDPLEASTAYPGAVRSVAALRAEGWRVSVCTQKTAGKARRLLEGLGFAVDRVVGGDSVVGPGGAEVLKPDPRVLAAALQGLGARAVFVGDSETDAQTAAAGGLPFLLHLGGYRRG